MLNIGKLAGGSAGADYYLAKVASSVEDYYTGAGEAPGHWTGAGTAALGLSGEVGGEQLRAVLAGTDPTSGEALSRPGSGRRVPGFDLTFRAPKSVALLWALGDHDAPGQVRAAHERAVAEALAYLEERACTSRRGSGGHESIAGQGFVGAALSHRTSRAVDPLLHTHVVVANAVQTVDDGKWPSLDARRLSPTPRPPATSTRPCCAASSPAASASTGSPSTTGRPALCWLLHLARRGAS